MTSGKRYREKRAIFAGNGMAARTLILFSVLIGLVAYFLVDYLPGANLLGGAAYTTFWAGILSLWLRGRIAVAAAFALSCAVEMFQSTGLTQPLADQSIVFRLLLGHEFDLADFFGYLIGATVSVIWLTLSQLPHRLVGITPAATTFTQQMQRIQRAGSDDTSR